MIETPIIVAEPHCFYEMGMSSVEAAHQRLDSVSIRIINPDHPLAAGYSGNVAVLAEPDESRLMPGPSRATTADSAAATVSITVTVVNDPPAASYDSATTRWDRPVVT